VGRVRNEHVTPEIVYKKLKSILTGKWSDERVVKTVLSWGLSKVTKENLEWAIRENVDLITLAFNHYHLGNPMIKPLFKLVLKVYWNPIEEYLTDVNKIYAVIVKNKPDCKEILDTPEGRDYLNRLVDAAYNYLYELAWGEE